jgi:hypothetical protein
VSSGQIFENLLPWFISSLEVGSGYNYGMAVDGPDYQILEGFAGISIVVILLIYCLVKRKRNPSIFILLNAELLFQSFKHGFVRHDGHVILFFFYYTIFFVLFYIIYNQDREHKIHHRKLTLKIPLLGIIVIFIINILILTGNATVSNIGQTVTSYATILPWIFDHSLQNQMNEDAKTMSKNHYQLDNQTINYIENKTVDVLPWDLVVPWAYNFNWDPRPMWWSFMVFTTYIDKLNAQHFLDENAPETVLYSFKSIDDRYPLFDEPLTFAAILQNYQYIHTSGEFVLLSHNYKQPLEKVELGTIDSEFGKIIKIPEYKEGYVFAHIDVKSNTIGKFINILYKPALAHITFKLSDGSITPEFRLLPGTSNDGVFVSQYVSNLYDLEPLFSDEVTQNIDGMIISVDDPIQYEKNVRVNFIGIPTNVLVKEGVKQINIPDWNSLNLVPGGLAIIDNIGNKQYNQEGSTINIPYNTNKIISISGWAIDDIDKEGNVVTFLVLKNEQDEKIFPTQKVHRQDLVNFFGVESYQNGGWRTSLEIKELEDVCYTLSLRIIKSNGLEYFEVNEEKPICFSM